MANREVKLKMSPDLSLKAIRALVEKKQGWTIRSFKPEEGMVAARTPASILSWGEDITIRVKASTEGSLVGIESNPAAQIFDWGRSASNVAALATEIAALQVSA